MASPLRTARAVLPSLLAAALLAAPAAALVIDDFEAGDFTFTDDSTAGGSSFGEVSGLPNARVKGGVRLVRQQVSTTGTLVPAVSTALLVTSGADDAAQLSVVGVPDGLAEYDFIYDGVANSDLDGVSGTLNLDLSGFDNFEIHALAPGVTSTVRVTLWSSVTVRNSAIVPLVDGITSFALSSFTLDLSDIQAIRVALEGIDNTETVGIQQIVATVPEPTTGLLVAAGLVGLAIRRGRRA